MNNICYGSGDGGNHCCYVDGEVCRFLTYVENRPRCSLMLEHQDWNKVHKDPRYLEFVKPCWEKNGVSDCGIFGTGRDGKSKECCFKDN